MQDDNDPLQPLLHRALAMMKEAPDNLVRHVAQGEHDKNTRMALRRAMAGPQEPVSPDALEALLARIIQLAAGGERDEALQLAHIATMATRAARAVRDLREEPLAFTPLVRSDPGLSGPFREQQIFEVSVTAAKASFSRLISHALSGDMVVVRRGGCRVARIVPYERVGPPSPSSADGAAPSDLPPLCPEDERDWFKPFEQDWDGR